MKLKPLKNKELSLALFLDSYDDGKHPPIYFGEDIASAVKWLKNAIGDDAYRCHITLTKGINNKKEYVDVDNVFDRIDEAFTDIQ